MAYIERFKKYYQPIPIRVRAVICLPFVLALSPLPIIAAIMDGLLTEGLIRVPKLIKENVSEWFELVSCISSCLITGKPCD